MQKINPPALLEPLGGAHVHVAITSPGRRLAFLAGQPAFAKDGTFVGKGDIGKQAEQAYANIRDTLAAIGAAPEDIVKLSIFVVDYRPEHFEQIDQAARTVFGDRKPITAASLLGVSALGLPDFLIEIEAVVELADERG